MTLHLAAALTGDSFAAADWIGWARQADDARLDFVTFEDTFGGRRPDAVLTAARVAPLTRHVGLVPVATTTHTEPFHLSTALATLDHVSRGRAGWQVRVSGDPAEAALLGRRAPLAFEELFAEAADVVEVVRRLWDSWEDDAIIKDVATGRYIDRQKLHYVDFAGEHFSVRGPSIVPRPPQGQPVVAALAHGPRAWQRLDVDVYFVNPQDAAEAVRQLPGRKVFVDLPVDAALAGWPDSGAAGVRLIPATPDDLTTIARELVPELRWRGLFTPSPAGTLRERLGLPQAVNRYSTAEAGHA